MTHVVLPVSSRLLLARPSARAALHARGNPLQSSTRFATQWAGGRPKEGHVVNRTDANDVQAEASQSGMKQKQEGKEGSQGISGKDEGGYNKKAEKDNPEAPQPVIGMNDERGQKGH